MPGTDQGVLLVLGAAYGVSLGNLGAYFSASVAVLPF